MGMFEVPLDGGDIAVIRELSATEFEGLYKRTSSAGADQGWELTQHGLRLSLKSIGDQKFKPEDLIGAQLSAKVNSVRRMMLLRQAWERIHLPTEEEMAGVRAMTAIES